MASTVGGVNNTYTYDGLGRRVREVEAASTYFFYGRSGQLLYTNDMKTSLRHNHIYLAGSLVAKRTVPFSGTPISVRYQHTDALGSPVAETSETGVLTRRERMTAYGEPADGTWQAGPGFTGHQMDATSRLVYMQQRYYDPVSGTFLSTDPVLTNRRAGTAFNRYTYANSNPYRFVDPDGRYGRDSTWSNDDWKQFDRAQKRAASRIEKAAKELDAALAEGGERLERAIKNFEDTFGAGSGTRQNMENVSANLTNMVVALTDDGSKGFFASRISASEMKKLIGRDATSVLAAGEVGGKRMYINGDHSESRNVSELVRTTGHESGHNFLLRDQRSTQGVPAYFNGNSAQQESFRTLPSSLRLINPDHLMEFTR